MDLGLKGCVALVTASSRGLGLASAKALAGEGASVMLCGRDEARLATAVADAQAAARDGAVIASLVQDVAAPDAAGKLVAEVERRFGKLDVLVTNAGGPPPGGFERADDAAWNTAFQLTLMSAARLMRAALPLLRASGRGRIINLLSTSVKQPIDNLLLSNALRPAVVGLAKTLSGEVASDGITVNNVLPGVILTDRQRELKGAEAARRGVSVEQVIRDAAQVIPARRIGQPEEVGALVAFLASTQAGYITGVSIQVDGGLVLGMF
jgi:3-oxoacyl-[acyl-carrier protein] reductase